jgi:hypothetical protein
MKKLSFINFIGFALMSVHVFSQAVGIGSSAFTPDASAMLEVQATNKGLLIPRVALTQTTSASPVTNPATSLLVYNTATVNDVTPGYYYWDGTKWVRLVGGKGDITCNTANFVLKSNGTDATCSQIFDDGTNVGIGTTSPTAKLHVNGTFRLTDGTEGAGKVLTSDAFGNASWQTLSAFLNINWINPVVIFSMGSGHHSNCAAWYVNDPTCGCGYEYNPSWDDCYWTGNTTTTPNSCPCAQYASYPNNTTNYNWQTINISSYVPAGTKNVLVEVDYGIATPDYDDVDAFVLVRANTSAATIPIARGRSAASDDNVAGLNTAIIPIDQSTRTFQLAVEQPGFDGGVTVRLLAYF